MFLFGFIKIYFLKNFISCIIREERRLLSLEGELQCWKENTTTKKAAEKGRDSTPSEIHLPVHTCGHDGKSFVGARCRIVHEKYQEILQQQTQTWSDIDQFQAYYLDAGGEKKNRIYGLGSQVKSYYEPIFFLTHSASNASPSTIQSTPTGNLDELMTRLVPVSAEHNICFLH